MRKVGILLFLVFGLIVDALSQDLVFGTNNYVEYQIGTLPVVISVPHGGNLNPMSIPDRTCNDPVYATDAFTIETAMAINQSIFEATGCYPHIIISHLKRSKLDCNRNLEDGACGNEEAIIAWEEFHNFIETAQNTANGEFQDKIFFVDLHGHGNPIQRIELGYLLYDDELELSDNTLNTAQYLNYSSIRNLALNNFNNLSHSQLLRGSQALGTLLGNSGYPSVPSEQIPYPGTATNYFSGGYITANHTCYAPGVISNGLQMELNYSGIRDSEINRSAFSFNFSSAILEFLNVHFNLDLSECSSNFIDEGNKYDVLVYPNPLQSDKLFVHINSVKTANYKVLNLFGQVVLDGYITDINTGISCHNLKSGVYIIHLSDANDQMIASSRFVVE